MNVHDPHAEDFDAAMHARYAQATMRLSPRTRIQLRSRLRATLAGNVREKHARRTAWLLATACSLALVFGFGMQWRASNDKPLATVPPVTLVAPQDTVVAAQPKADSGEQVAMLDESPDLYLWLASDDAKSFATE
jgi:hypothetical protein